MEFFTPLRPENASSLGMALVVSSSTPLLLLSQQLIVQAASGSFCRNFGIDPRTVVGTELFELGDTEWNVPQLRTLMKATASGSAAIDAYEMDLKRTGKPTRNLVLNAHVLDHPGNEVIQLVLSVIDQTEIRRSMREKIELARDNDNLLQELHHRVANSLQIIASVLMQRVRGAQSEETRGYLRDAHHRVMSIATLQRQLAATASGDVRMGPYLTELCDSIGASMIPDPSLLTLTVTADDMVGNGDRSVSMGLIVTELVINSLKHAFPKGTETGTIKVDLRKVADGWVLTVADDGRGIAADHADSKPGLGTGIVNALAAQLGAEVVTTPANPGTLVTVTHDGAA